MMALSTTLTYVMEFRLREKESLYSGLRMKIMRPEEGE